MDIYDYDTLSKRSYPPTFRSFCDRNPWYHFLPLTGSHRLKCVLNVTLERKGREDVSTSYSWETSKIDWWLAANLEQLQLNEFAFRLKLMTWKHRNPFMSRPFDIPEFKYHWVRPGHEKEEPAQEDELEEELEATSARPPHLKLKNKLAQPFKGINPQALLFFFLSAMFVLFLVYFNPRT